MITSVKPSPLLSIGLPVYNGERFLAQALDCLLAQTFRDFEIIISDNASTDRTPEICRAYARRDPRVRYVCNQRNLGRSQISIASSSYQQRLCLSGRPTTTFIARLISRAAFACSMNILTSFLLIRGTAFIDERGEPFPFMSRDRKLYRPENRI